MKRTSIVRIAFVCLLLSATMLAATQTVTATGDCGTDMNNLQAAVGAAAPGDTIQLQPGPNGLAFNLSCATGDVVMYVTTPDITISGAQGAVLNGPGLNDNFSAAIFAEADAITITGVTIQNFNMAVGVGFQHVSTTGVAITNSTFVSNVSAVWVPSFGAKALRVTNNKITIPASPDADASGPSGMTFGIVVSSGADDLIIDGNTIQGPGRVVQWKAWDDIATPNPAPQMEIRSAGIWQSDYQPPAAVRGRISNNTVDGVDLGIQASSNFGVVTHNVVTNSGSGVAISNDTDDGVNTVTDNVVALNTAANDLFGIIVQSGTRNVIVDNDATHNAIAGLLFAAYPGASNSTTNTFLLDSGSKSGVSGNQGVFHLNPNYPPAH